jgi:hypothetical protein
MSLNRYQIFGWEMIANVRRWATCAANSSLNMRKIYNFVHPSVSANGDRGRERAKEFKIGAIVADLKKILIDC